ncbi:MAG: class I SAM-dependent methyltransferase [Thermoanaerobaculia bacterium]
MDHSIDPAAVRRYFDAVGGAAATAGYMAHERKLPAAAAAYRKQCELRILRDWLDAVPASAHVLDAGCGSGNWTEVFAARFARVIGIDQSNAMVEAARRRLAPLRNVSIITGDVLRDLPNESFDLIFVGGVCMYLNDGDVETLLQSLAARLRAGGTIILRESTVRRGRRVARGEYQAVYRSVGDYRTLIGARPVEIRRNRGYERFEIAADLADLVPGHTGSMVWRVARASTPLTFILLPRLMDALRVEWPRLQNHFFRVR